MEDWSLITSVNSFLKHVDSYQVGELNAFAFF